MYAIAVGFLAVLLIAPWTSEFAAKVAVLAALAIVCAARPVLLVLESRGMLAWFPSPTGRARPASRVPLAGAAAIGAVVVAGIPARPAPAVAAPLDSRTVPEVTILASQGVSPTDNSTGRRIASDLVVDLEHAAEALRTRNRARAGRGATGAGLDDLWARIDASRGGTVDVTTYRAERVRLRLVRGDGQGPPTVVATLTGTSQTTTYGRLPADVVQRSDPRTPRRPSSSSSSATATS